MPPSSPIPHDTQQEWPTPIRAKVRSDRFEHHISLSAIENLRHVPKSTVKTICDAPTSRRVIHYEKTEEKRGRKSKITPKYIREMEKILEEGFDSKTLTW